MSNIPLWVQNLFRGGFMTEVTKYAMGAVKAIGGARTVCVSSDGESSDWAKLSSDYIDSVDWDTLINKPTLLGIAIGSPVRLLAGGGNNPGSGVAIALANHTHQMSVDYPVDIGTANAPGTSANFVRGDHVHALPFSVVQSVLSAASDAIAVNNQRVTGMADPINSHDGANKEYVDAQSQGLTIRQPVDAIATTVLVANMTGLTTTADGVALNADGKRVFVMGSDNPAKTGIWVVHSGAWTRPADFATGASAKGAYFLVLGGTVYGGSAWVCNASNDGLYVIDSSLLNFVQFFTPTTVSAGNGLTKTGSTIDVVCDDGSITVASDAIRVNSVAYSKITGAPTSMTPTAHAASHRPGGSDEIGYPSNTAAGLVAPITAADSVYLSNDNGTTMLLSKLVDRHIASTANIAVDKLAKGASGLTTILVSDGTHNTMSTPASIGIVTLSSVTKNGTHRTHRYHDERAFVPSNDGANPTVIDYTEATWKGDTVAPNSATWITRATVTVRVQYVDTVNYTSIDRTYKTQLYWQRVGGVWGISGGTQLTETLGSPTGGLSLQVTLVGSNAGTVRVSITQYPAPANVSDMVMFLDIEGGGNYAS